jgi:hypothetical protein
VYHSVLRASLSSFGVLDLILLNHYSLSKSNIQVEVQKKFKDIKGIIRSRKSKNDTQDNDKKEQNDKQ